MSTFTTILSDEQTTLEFAAGLARVMGNTAIIYLQGPLGAGKTTFSRGFLRGLGYAGTVKSPTYTLVEPYQVGGRTIYHFDFYRLRDPEELEFIGIRDYFTPPAICLIEWPDCGKGQIPEPDLVCQLKILPHGREIILEATSICGEELINRMKEGC